MDEGEVKVLVACEFSGRVRDAFAKRGHDAWSCDLLPSETAGQHIQGDVLGCLNEGWDLMIAHPPCTYLTTTGNKWFKPEFRDRFPTRERDREDAVRFFLALANAPVERIAIENPVGIMSTLYRKPNQIIQPYEFGHIEAKKTCLWLRRLPPLLMFNQSQEVPEYTTFKSGKRMATWYVKSASSDNRASLRSRTFENIANAMAEQWG